MSKHEAFTRREFLHSSLAVVSTVGTMPTFLGHAATALAATGGVPGAKAGVPEDRILVVVQLSGGNDGLNTVIPFGQPSYYDLRPRLAVAQEEVIRLDHPQGIGLHPQMAAMKEMLEEGLVCIVQGVGYPNPNRSHFASMDVWHTGDTRGGRGVGWIGAAVDLQAQDAGGDGMTCITMGREVPLAAQGRQAKPVSFERADLFRWTAADLHESLGQTYAGINRAGVLPDAGLAEPGGQAAFVMRTALDAQLASDRVRAAVAGGSSTTFPPGDLAGQLRTVAAMIRGGLPTRVYYVALGGFDTHANQAFPHGRNLADFSAAVRAFYTELKALGRQEQVLTMAFSEFGRRVAQNASGGTDHGTAGPMFLLGPMVRPGIVGSIPSLTDLDEGDLRYHTDFRSVYAAVLDHWMKIDSRAVLGAAYKPAPVLA